MLVSVLSPSPRRSLLEQRVDRALADASGGSDRRSSLLRVQAALGCVPTTAEIIVAEYLGCSLKSVSNMAKSLDAVCEVPRARHRITICTGKTCARRGGSELLRDAREQLEVDVFETSADEAIYLEPFRCFGQCAMAPNIRIDGGVRGAMTRDRLALLVDMLRR